MAELPNKDLTPQERQDRIEAQTSVGQYALKQAKQWGIEIAGVVGGYFGFKTLRDTGVGNVIEKIVPASIRANMETGTRRQILPWVGAFLGLIVSNIINFYGHWKNIESEKLAVAEINKDVANMTQERQAFATTLTRQEGLIKELIAARKDKTPGLEIASDAPLQPMR